MRWKAFIPTVVITALIAVFTIFFMDGMIERAIEKVGTSANGAKVELDSVRTSIIHLTVTLNRLQVADEQAPMTNSFDIGRIQFHLAPKPLTWKKIIIEDASITDIRTGTARKYSGAIAKKDEEKKPEEPSKAAELGKEAASFAVANLKEQYDPKQLVSTENLASYKKIQEEQARFAQLSQDWQARVDAVKVEDKAKEADAFVKSVKGENFSGIEGLKKAKDTLDQAAKLRDDFQQTQKSFNELKSSLQNEIAQSKNALKEIDALRQQDMDNAVGQVKSGFSAEGITRGLIGPEWNGRLQTGLGWFQKVRKLIPEKKAGEKEPPPPPRLGRDISFPFRYSWPAFHLKHASLSGVTSGDRPLDYKGVLTDVSSDPKLVGRPIALEVAGKSASGSEALALRAEFDFTKDVARQAVKMKYSGLPLAGTKLGNVGGPVSIKDGMGTVEADLEARGEQISGTIDFNAAPAQLEHTPDKTNDRLMALLHDVLSGVNALNIGVRVSDTISSPNLKITSSIDNQLNDAVKQVLQKQLDELKAQVQRRVDELIKGERQKLLDMVNNRTGGVTEKLNQKDGALKAAQDQVQKAMDDLKKKAASSAPIPGLGGGDSNGKPAVPDLKKLFKKK